MGRLCDARPGSELKPDLMGVLHVARRGDAGLAWAATAVDVRQGTLGEPR